MRNHYHISTLKLLATLVPSPGGGGPLLLSLGLPLLLLSDTLPKELPAPPIRPLKGPLSN